MKFPFLFFWMFLQAVMFGQSSFQVKVTSSNSVLEAFEPLMNTLYVKQNEFLREFGKISPSLNVEELRAAGKKIRVIKDLATGILEEAIVIPLGPTDELTPDDFFYEEKVRAADHGNLQQYYTLRNTHGYSSYYEKVFVKGPTFQISVKDTISECCSHRSFEIGGDNVNKIQRKSFYGFVIANDRILFGEITYAVGNVTGMSFPNVYGVELSKKRKKDYYKDFIFVEGLVDNSSVKFVDMPFIVFRDGICQFKQIRLVTSDSYYYLQNGVRDESLVTIYEKCKYTRGFIDDKSLPKIVFKQHIDSGDASKNCVVIDECEGQPRLATLLSFFKSSGLKNMMTSFMASQDDFGSIFKHDNPRVLYGQYSTKMLSYLDAVAWADYDLSDYTVECKTISEVQKVWKSRNKIMPTPANDKQMIYKVSIYNSVGTSVELYFVQMTEDDFKILQFPLLFK